jgi:hypothetical protein
MSILTAIGEWLLRIFLGGIFKDVQNKEANKAKAERDRAQIAAQTADENIQLEREIRNEYDRIGKVFKERELPPEDPFGWKSWNRGE